MSKLSFRARALDPSKPMPIYLAEELPDLPEYSAINRAVPQMPSGMEKEEESEHHLQRAICTGLIIPTPEVYEATDSEFYERYYAQDYKMPKQLIHMQPLNLEQDVPDYDMDSADEQWITTQGKRLDLDALKFETMMDRLEKSSGQTVVTLNEAKALLKQDDELSIAVYDYWLNKRLKTQHPLILSVKTESRGNTTPNNPYLAFRRRTEKMQTRKNRKNDESSYEKMLKLRRDLSRAVTLLEMIKRREKIKREQLHLSIEVYEKRYQAQDFSGQMLAEFTSNATKASRPAFAPIYSNQYSSHHSALAAGQGVASGSGAGVYGSGSSSQYHVSGSSSNKRDNESLSSSRKEKRQYKKRKHKQQKDRASGSGSAVAGSSGVGSGGLGPSGVGGSAGVGGYHYQYHPAGVGLGGPSTSGSAGARESAAAGGLGSGAADSVLTSDEEELSNLQGTASPEEEHAYAFRRSKFSQYHKPITNGSVNWPWEFNGENGTTPDPRYRFALTSLRHPRPRCIGFARRRIGRGGRVIIDRASTSLDDLWSRLDYKIIETDTTPAAAVAIEPEEEPIVISTVVPPATPFVVPAVPVPLLDKKIHGSSSSSEFVVTNSGGIKRKRQLVIKEETDLDELFLAGVGLVRKTAEGQSEVKVKQEMCSDERTSPTSAAFVISSSDSTSGNVNNSENNVIKSEAGGDAMDVEIKQEILEDYEHMIDNVNNSYRNRISNSSRTAAASGNNISSSSSSSNVNNRNNFIQSFSNSISGSAQSRGLSQNQQQQQQPSSSRSLSYQMATTSGSLQSSRSRQIAEELGLDTGSPLDSQAIASVYTDLLDEIQSSWLHFRPKTPEPLPLEDDLLQDDPLFQTDANRIALELQTLGDELPLDVFNPRSGNVFRTKPFAMDSLVEPHPLGLENGAGGSRKDGDDLGVKLETCSNSDNNLSGDSLNDLNLSLNESGEDEKMLDKILQECQIDDMKSLNQTSNFWNGILEDGILNQLEAADDAGAGTGTDTKEDPLVMGELASPPPVDGLPVNKLGYCSELVGYDRPATVERYKNKRRKILKRCNFQVGSSFFTVRNPPKEEILRKLSDSEDAVPVDGTEKAIESNPSEAAANATDADVKMEEDSEPVSATIPADQIKIEPPDELLAASSPSVVTLSHSATTTHLHGNTTTVLHPASSSTSTFHHPLSAATQIKLEAPLNHLPQPVSSSVVPSAPSAPTTSFLIASPSVQVQVQQPPTVVAGGSGATMLNPLVATAQTSVPVQPQPSHSQITIATASPSGSASNSGTSTPTGSYIVQHTTPIVLSQQQMQQIATSGGNIVTVSGNQVVTTKQQQQLQAQQAQHPAAAQHVQIQNANALGEALFSLSPLKKQINGPNEKTAKQNVIGSRFLINQRLSGGQKPGDLNKKQLEMISKALDIRQKMMIKTATQANHNAAQVQQLQQAHQQVQQQQQQQQQQIASGSSTYNVIHQNSLQQPITILSATTSQNPQQPTQNKIILTSSPQLIQQAAGQLMAAAAANPHGKIAINSNLVASAGQQAQQYQATDGSGQGHSATGATTTVQAGQPQHVKLEKTVNMLFDADKNRIVYANIKNSRGQFLAQINPKVVNILQPIQQQKLVNNVGALQQAAAQQQHTTTNVQNLLGASPTTTILNSKGGIQRIPAVSIRAQQHQQQQQQLASQQLDGTTTVALATNNATNSIKFIQVTPAAVNDGGAGSSSASGGAGASSVVAATSVAASATVVSSAGGASSAGASGSSTATPTSINITNSWRERRVCVVYAGGSASSSSSSSSTSLLQKSLADQNRKKKVKREANQKTENRAPF